MPLKAMRVINFRAFKDSGYLKIDSIGAFVGKNDSGKSSLLHALNYFFNPPTRNIIPLEEVHCGNKNSTVEIEIILNPKLLTNNKIKLDSKNEVDLFTENILDKEGHLHCKMVFPPAKSGKLHICIQDYESDDFFGMTINKKEKDLLELLTSKGLEAKKSGKISNKERRDSLRQFAKETGILLKEDWVEIHDQEKEFRNIFPSFIFFQDNSRYDISETPVQNQFKDISQIAIEQLEDAEAIKTKAEKIIQDEFNIIDKYYKSLSTGIESIEAHPDINWKKAIDKITLSWKDGFGIEVPYYLRGAGVRRIFMVAYFQYKAAKGFMDDKGTKYIFAIEEPEVHLHPGAQRELLSAIKDLTLNNHVVLFTTHSPVFASTVSPNSLILVQRDNKFSRANQIPNISLENIADELGIVASDRLIGANYVVLVEGKSDEQFLTSTLSLFYESGYTKLNPSEVMFLQCGGIGNIKYTVNGQYLQIQIKLMPVALLIKTQLTQKIRLLIHVYIFISWKEVI